MNKLEFAKALRKPSEEDVKRITEHFQAQNDLYTQCPSCGTRLYGTYQQIVSHECDFSKLIGQ